VESNALVRLTNRTGSSLVIETDIAKPVKFVSRLIIPPNGLEVDVEYVTALAFFSREFQNLIASGSLILTFSYVTFRGVQSTAGNFVANMNRFFNADKLGWQIS